MIAPALLLASAFLHASWNALLKRERSPQLAVAGVLAAALLVTAIAAALAPRGASFSPRPLAWGIAGGLCEGAYFVTLAAALARAEYGAVYAIARGGAMALVWPASALLLREPVTVHGASGAALVTCGLVLVVTAGRRAWPSATALGFAVACAASIAGYHLCYDRALHGGARPAPLFAIALATALPIVLAASRGRWSSSASSVPGGRDLLRWSFAGILCSVSFLLFLAGMAMAGPAIAITLRNASIVFAQLLALSIGERPGLRQLAGSGILAVGATMAAS